MAIKLLCFVFLSLNSCNFVSTPKFKSKYDINHSFSSAYIEKDTIVENNIIGAWCGSELESEEYFLRIKKSQDNYIIYYCFNNLDGSTIDCPDDSIVVNSTKKGIYNATFKNSFNDQLSYKFQIKNDSLKFFLLKGNIGFSLFKSEMSFVRCDEK